ncbi:MAG: DUF805 domain-containing protein [Acetobacteraceae bacterium]|nr:DUF805 domain-containing protein [Acetobacteraceae bacterium]
MTQSARRWTPSRRRTQPGSFATAAIAVPTNLRFALVAAVLDGAIATDMVRHLNVFSTILSIVFFLPSLAVTARRLHDIGRSGWWMLISLVPIVGSIVLLVWLCTRGYEGPNRFGSDPIGPMQPGPAGAVA